MELYIINFEINLNYFNLDKESFKLRFHCNPYYEAKAEPLFQGGSHLTPKPNKAVVALGLLSDSISRN